MNFILIIVLSTGLTTAKPREHLDRCQAEAAQRVTEPGITAAYCVQGATK